MSESKTNDHVPMDLTIHRPPAIDEDIAACSQLTESDGDLFELVRLRLASKEAAIEVNIDDL